MAQPRSKRLSVQLPSLKTLGEEITGQLGILFPQVFNFFLQRFDLGREQFMELRDLVERTLEKLPQPGMMPVRITGIRNKTAAKYIRLLIQIEQHLTDQS